MSLQSLDFGTETVDLKVVRNARAKRMTLRVDAANGNVVLTLPKWVSENEGLKFVSEKTNWIRRQLRNLPTAVPFAAGSVVPFLGEDHQILAYPARRGPAGFGPVWREPGTLRVAGDPAHHARRLKDWFTRQARQRISPNVQRAAAILNTRANRITVRDTTSRWGSCSPTGTLSFSWRLVMAPEHVLDYVACHEVAHLRELNHSPRFWDLVEQLHPDYHTAEAWLKHFGPGLHRFG